VTIETSGHRPSRQYEPPLMSWEEFLAWALRQERRFEWVDGEIVEFMPDSIRHLLVVRFVFLLIHQYVEHRRLGLTLFSGLLMRLPQRPSGRVPDVTFVSTERLNRMFETYFDGPVDLAVEVVSPESARRDYRDKLAEYEAAGIREYWLIDPLQTKAWFYVLGTTGQYQEVPPDAGGIYTSTVLAGLQLRVDWLWRDMLPTVDEALADLSE
jgi:Uma2 family endonuclease